MAAPAHDRFTLARFQDGEQRLVYARRKDQPGELLYFLKDNTAADLKAWAKEHLECFLPDCPDRRLTTVARRGKRDGFKHNSGSGGHGREGLFHEQGKAFFERWARERYPHVQVALERATRSKERRADVMLTWPNGAQVAVEVQYAAISPQEWQHRHDSYRNQGIIDVWLFGHIAPHLREKRPPIGEHISLQPVHYAVLEAGMPLLWINPILELVATAWQAVEGPYDGSSRGTRYEVPPVWSAGRDPVAFFRTVALSECELSPTGLMFSFLNGLIRAGQRLQEALARQERARQKRLERARADEAKKEAQAAAKLANFTDGGIPARPPGSSNGSSPTTVPSVECWPTTSTGTPSCIACSYATSDRRSTGRLLTPASRCAAPAWSSTPRTQKGLRRLCSRLSASWPTPATCCCCSAAELLRQGQCPSPSVHPWHELWATSVSYSPSNACGSSSRRRSYKRRPGRYPS